MKPAGRIFDAAVKPKAGIAGSDYQARSRRGAFGEVILSIKYGHRSLFASPSGLSPIDVIFRYDQAADQTIDCSAHDITIRWSVMPSANGRKEIFAHNHRRLEIKCARGGYAPL